MKEQVPLYLRTSCFYQAIEDDDDSFEVPSDCFKENQFVESEADLRLLLSTLRFWGSDQMPASIVTFVSLHRPKLVLSTFAMFKQELRYLGFLEALCVGTDANSSPFYYAFNGCIVNARFDAEVKKAAAQICILQYETCDGRVWDYDTSRLAAKFGLLDVLKFLQQHGCPWDARTCSTAAEWGHLHVLQYAHAHGCSWDEETCREAARKGNLTCLQYAVQNDCPYGEQTLLAASENNGRCHAYLSKLRSLSGPQQCATAAKKGSLTLLKKLRDKGLDWDETTPTNAAQGGFLPILKYAHENGCPWDASTCNAAAASSLECLQYAHEHGCPWDEQTTGYACQLRTEKYWLSTAPRSAKTLKYAHEHGCPWNVYFIYPAIIWVNYEALEYALSHGCQTNPEALLFTVSCGDEKMMEIVHRHGFRFGERAVEEAISVSGHKIKNLEFLLQHGYPCAQNACTLAAAQSLQGLKLLREHGCPWDESTCAAAARADKLDCLQYMRTHGCPWDIGTVRAAMEGGALSCLKYAHENGCAWDASLVNKIPLTSKTRKCIEYVQDHPEPIKVSVPSVTAILVPAASHHQKPLATAVDDNCVPPDALKQRHEVATERAEVKKVIEQVRTTENVTLATVPSTPSVVGNGDTMEAAAWTVVGGRQVQRALRRNAHHLRRAQQACAPQSPDASLAIRQAQQQLPPIVAALAESGQPTVDSLSLSAARAAAAEPAEGADGWTVVAKRKSIKGKASTGSLC